MRDWTLPPPQCSPEHRFAVLRPVKAQCWSKSPLPPMSSRMTALFEIQAPQLWQTLLWFCSASPASTSVTCLDLGGIKPPQGSNPHSLAEPYGRKAGKLLMTRNKWLVLKKTIRRKTQTKTSRPALYCMPRCNKNEKKKNRRHCFLFLLVLPSNKPIHKLLGTKCLVSVIPASLGNDIQKWPKYQEFSFFPTLVLSPHL